LLGDRLTDGGKVVSFAPRPRFTPQEDSWYSFLLEAESAPGAIMWLKGLSELKNPVTSLGIEPAPNETLSSWFFL
jgi:hypothetical protein